MERNFWLLPPIALQREEKKKKKKKKIKQQDLERSGVRAAPRRSTTSQRGVLRAPR